MAIIDYLTVSLGAHISKNLASTSDLLTEFASILPDLYKNTCKEMLCSDGKTMRVSQYGITVSRQYGTAQAHGWEYTVQLAGDYWHAIERDRGAVLKILSGFSAWRVSRLDLASDACVSIDDWRKYYKAAFNANDYNIIGMSDARTVYYGSRKSQFFTRIYNKTAEDGKHYPAADGFVQIRFEVETHRIKGELVLDHTFDNEFTDLLFLQRVHRSTENDSSGFIEKYYAADAGEKIRTVKRTLGNLEDTIDYVFDAYAPYIAAVMHSQLVADRYVGIEDLNDKGKKILAVLDSDSSTKRVITVPNVPKKETVNHEYTSNHGY